MPDHQPRPQSVPNPVWALAARTGVYHADPDCPAIRGTITYTRAGMYRRVFELDRATGTAWLWLLQPTGDWLKAVDDPTHADTPTNPARFRFTPNRWRPCLRCGSLRPDGTYTAQVDRPTSCPRCHLTPCDCDD